MGGGWAGLAASLAVSREGHDTSLIEGDSFEDGASWARAFEWHRPGLSHFFQPHAFLPRAYKELSGMFPDVLQRVLGNGGYEVDLARKIPQPHDRVPEDDDLKAVGARRPLLEWAFRLAIFEEAKVRIVGSTRVEGLSMKGGRVAGVETAGGVMDADLVIDATGRNSHLNRWLQRQGLSALAEDSTDCQVLYYCRYHVFKDGGHMPEGPWPFGPRGDTGYGGYNTFFGDNNTFGVVLMAPAWDKSFRILRFEDAWMTFASSMPFLDQIVAEEVSTPITPVMPVGQLHNKLVHFHDQGPAVVGVLPIGDALVHTNPMFAWGLSSALIHVAHLVAALRDSSSDPSAVADRYFEGIGALSTSCYTQAVEIDRIRSTRWRGENLDLRPDGDKTAFVTVAGAVASVSDPDVFRAVMRKAMLLDDPSALQKNDQMLGTIEAVFDSAVVAGLPPPPGPPRDEMLKRLQEVRPR